MDAKTFEAIAKQNDVPVWTKWQTADAAEPDTMTKEQDEKLAELRKRRERMEKIKADPFRETKEAAREALEGMGMRPKNPEEPDMRIHIATLACGRGVIASLDHETDVVVCPCLTAATDDRHVVYVKGADPVHMCPKHYAIFLQLWQIHLLETSLKERGVKNLLTV